MATARITAKGQITIPRQVRGALGVEAGDSVAFIVEGKYVYLVPIKRRTLAELRGVLKTDKPRASFDEERRAARQAVVDHVLGLSQDAGDE